MQSSADLYPPFTTNAWYAAIVAIAAAVLLLTRLFGGKLLKFLALRDQKKRLSAMYATRPKVIEEALQKIAAIEHAYTAGTVDAAHTAEALSATVRHYFDQLMNHRTLSASRQEIVDRHLQKLGDILGASYPAEFNTQNTGQQIHSGVFAAAKEVLQSCR